VQKNEIVQIISNRLAKSRAQFEIFFSQKKTLSCDIKEGQLDHFRSSMELGIALRTLDDGKLGFSYLYGPNPDTLIQLTDRAVEMASQADPDPLHSFSPPERANTQDLEVFDNTLSQIPYKEKVERIKEMEQGALNVDARIRKVRKAEYEETTSYTSMVNSYGLDAEKQGTAITVSIMVLAEDNGDAEMGWESETARWYDDIDPKKIGMNAARRGIAMLGGRQISTRTCPAVLENRVVGELLDVWSSSFLGENIHKGKSFLQDRVGQKIASKKITLIDDGLYNRGLGSAWFDDEGTPQKSTILVQKGTLLTYLFDHYWSRKAGSQSTGNSVRERISSPPSPGPSNLFIRSGTLSFDQLLKSMNEGLLVTDLMGVHMSDPISGDFSVGASGIWVEKGRPAYPVKGVTISGSIHSLFADVADVGDDLRFFGRLGAPSALMKEINVSGL
jgi:PmbA protein